MGWLLDLFRRTLPPCAPGRQFGRHGEVLDGLGGMGDARLCLRCGLEAYDDSGLLFAARESLRDVEAPDDWPAIEAARALPGGIHSK
jgi:hypothetical protein